MDPRPKLSVLSCTVPLMAERPTTSWRHGIAEEAKELAAGTLDPECACMVGLFPYEPLTATDEVLDSFEDELLGWARPATRRSSSSWNALSWP